MAHGVTARRWVVDRRARLLAALAAALTLAFVALAWWLQRAAGTAVDLAITLGIQWIDDPAFALLMLAISAPGFAPWNWLVPGVVMIGLWSAGSRRGALFLLATPGASLLAGLAKLLVERPRPAGDGVRVVSELLDFSYPSGHVVGYVSFYGFLFFLTYVLFKRSWWRTVVLVLLGLLVALVGVSRIYLGHHWASDVFGGYALGTAYLLLLIELYRATSPHRQPGEEPARGGAGRRGLPRSAS